MIEISCIGIESCEALGAVTLVTSDYCVLIREPLNSFKTIPLPMHWSRGPPSMPYNYITHKGQGRLVSGPLLRHKWDK